MSGSPPQMLTMGAPASSTALRHSSTESFSLMVCEYSRIRPQPVQVRLQACSGSSIRTRGKRFSRVIFFLAMYVAIDDVKDKGKRMLGSLHFIQAQGWQPVGLLKPRQCHQRKIQRIHMVLEIKDLGEPGAGEGLFV